MSANIEAILRGMADVFAGQPPVEKVYLFGSHARGNAGPDSDIDLLIVEQEPFGPRRSRRREMARFWRLLAPFPVPKDILVYTADEVEKWKTAKNQVVAHALQEGRLLYERP